MLVCVLFYCEVVAVPRARSPKRDKAYQIWIKSNKTKTSKEIAVELGVSESQIRKWKAQDKWNGNTGKKTKSDVTKKKAIAEDVQHVLDNPDLTDKQRLFCLYYVRSFNATKSYQKAYECSYGSAAVGGFDLLRNPKIKAEIYKLKQNRLNREMLTVDDIVQKYMDIAFADITDYVTFGQETRPVIGINGPIEVKNEETGEKEILQKEVNVVRFKDSTAVDGTLIAEIKQGKDGASIKLLDSLKALEWLSNYFELNPFAKHRQEYEKKRLEIEMVRLESQIKEPEEEMEESGFTDALNASAKDVWHEDD